MLSHCGVCATEVVMRTAHNRSPPPPRPLLTLRSATLESELAAAVRHLSFTTPRTTNGTDRASASRLLTASELLLHLPGRRLLFQVDIHTRRQISDDLGKRRFARLDVLHAAGFR